jgi:hypothetical protein
MLCHRIKITGLAVKATLKRQAVSDVFNGNLVDTRFERIKAVA